MAASCATARRRTASRGRSRLQAARKTMLTLEPRVLVVDDDPLVRDELQGLLTGQTLKVDSVGSVPEALTQLAESQFSLALVDVRIGGGDGIALMREIRERWPDVDVIMIT